MPTASSKQPHPRPDGRAPVRPAASVPGRQAAKPAHGRPVAFAPPRVQPSKPRPAAIIHDVPPTADRAPVVAIPADRARRVEMILEQVHTLPTLSPVAVRLLNVTSAEDADLQEIISLIEADPALTGRMLALCRRANLGLSQPVSTVRRAVVLLGLEAVQSAVLSVQIFDLFNRAPGSDEKPDADSSATFDRAAFWKHSIAVACCAELLAEAHRGSGSTAIRPDEAFTAGLLHDLGKVVLHWILPKSYAKVIDLADARGISMADAERAIIGLDHHTIGKRLAEHWGLPHALQDAIWLHNQPAHALPDVPNQRLVAIITASDAICRRLHLGWAGGSLTPPPLETICESCGLDPLRVQAIEPKLHEALAKRCADLGLDEQPANSLMLESIGAANRRLSRLNQTLAQRAALSRRQARTLATVQSFLTSSRGSQTVADALACITGSLATLFEDPADTFFATLYQARAGASWRLACHAPDGATLSSAEVEGPRDADGRLTDLLTLLQPARQSSGGLGGTIGLVSFLSEHLKENPSLAVPDLRRLFVTPIDTGVGPVAAVIHDQPLREADNSSVEVLTNTWAACLAAAAQTQGARRLGEALAQTSRVLAESQQHRAEMQAMARLGEVTAGAAHEMNNPLAVISGRSQLLAERLKNYKDKADAQEVSDAAQRLSDLITRLHKYARPPEPKLRQCVVIDLVKQAINLARTSLAQPSRVTSDRLHVPATIPDAFLDPDLFAEALAEVIRNGMDASGDQPIDISVKVSDTDDKLVVTIKDRGPGMSDVAIRHAFDPFFSEKQAGRQVGLGLAIARRFLGAIGGQIQFSSTQGKGTTVDISLEKWRAARQENWKEAAA